MPLTDEIKKKLYNCIIDKSNTEIDKNKILENIGESIDNKYTYERTADYYYKNTDILINKLNITNDKELY